MESYGALPGGDLVEAGLRDLRGWQDRSAFIERRGRVSPVLA